MVEADMDWDTEKIDNAALAFLYLALHDGDRAWKNLDWEAMSRLHAKGLIEDPRNKNKSVVLTPEGLQLAEKAAIERFSSPSGEPWTTLKSRPDTQYKIADGKVGVLCRNAVDGSYFFRVYQSDGSFEDCDLLHDELSVQIGQDAMAALYRRGERAYLDHDPQVLGLNDE